MIRIPPSVITFAATDPSSGAGLQADILTFASIGCYPLSVVTAITVQDTVGVENVMVFDADWVNDQARAILEDMQVSAFKLGMLGSVENVAVIAEIMADYPDIPLLIDPVLASGRGDELTNEEMQAAMIELLFPQATLITPNSLEARRLAFLMTTAMPQKMRRWMNVHSVCWQWDVSMYLLPEPMNARRKLSTHFMVNKA